LVTGRGERDLTDLEGLRPLVKDEDVIAIGSRPDDEWRQEARSNKIRVIDVADLHSEGAAATGRRVAREMGGGGLDGYWIHLDVDVLDPTVMPAVDSPDTGGLLFEELGALVRELLTSELAVGLEVTVFDPDLDEDGSLAARLTETLVLALA